MDEDLKEMIGLLKKCFPILLENPKVMTGCDISDEEIEKIKQNKRLSIEMLEHVAGDDFFGTYYDDVGLNEDEGIKVNKFLCRSASYFIEELKGELNCLNK